MPSDFSSPAKQGDSLPPIPPARGRRGDPDWSIAMVFIVVGWLALVSVGAYFFWSAVTP